MDSPNSDSTVHALPESVPERNPGGNQDLYTRFAECSITLESVAEPSSDICSDTNHTDTKTLLNNFQNKCRRFGLEIPDDQLGNILRVKRIRHLLKTLRPILDIIREMAPSANKSEHFGRFVSNRIEEAYEVLEKIGKIEPLSEADIAAYRPISRRIDNGGPEDAIENNGHVSKSTIRKYDCLMRIMVWIELCELDCLLQLPDMIQKTAV